MAREATRTPNKGMKLTKPEHIGALQLIPGVRRTRAGECGEYAEATRLEMTLPDVGYRSEDERARSGHLIVAMAPQSRRGTAGACCPDAAALLRDRGCGPPRSPARRMARNLLTSCRPWIRLGGTGESGLRGGRAGGGPYDPVGLGGDPKAGKAGQARLGKLAWGVRGANEPPNNAI